MQQKQDIKGFTILELLVVITIVAIVSAVGYPNFMEWSEDRKVRKASEQIASMLTNINTQLQRDNFQYVQFQIIPGGTSSTTIRTKGIANITSCKRGMSNDCTIYPLKIWNLTPLINEIPQVQIGVKHE